MSRIDLQNVSIDFPIYNANSRSLKNRFIRMATGGTVVKDANQRITVHALKNVSLTIDHGDRVGIIGHNGAGKSTLLKLLAGIYEPTLGNLRILGKITPLLSLTVGVEAEYTGYENIYLRGTLLGLTKAEINRQIDEIAEFTGLGDYLHMPTRTYSAGMMVRLAFAISVSVNPEILLIDEIFGAGDSDFMEKAKKRMVDLLNQSSIVIMANHATSLIKEFCNKCLLLEGGEIKYYGSVDEALKLYHSIYT